MEPAATAVGQLVWGGPVFELLFHFPSPKKGNVHLCLCVAFSLFGSALEILQERRANHLSCLRC